MGFVMSQRAACRVMKVYQITLSFSTAG